MRENKVIAFCGKMASGKDSYGSLLIDELKRKCKLVEHYSFANPLKDEVNYLVKMIRGQFLPEQMAKNMNSTIEDIEIMLGLIQDECLADLEYTSRSRTPNMRKALQYWGTDVRRKSNEAYWVELAKKNIQRLLDQGYWVVVTDARFMNEFECIKELDGVLIKLNVSEEAQLKRIRERDGIEVDNRQLKHASEVDCEIYRDFDVYINTDNAHYTILFGALLLALERSQNVVI